MDTADFMTYRRFMYLMAAFLLVAGFVMGYVEGKHVADRWHAKNPPHFALYKNGELVTDTVREPGCYAVYYDHGVAVYIQGMECFPSGEIDHVVMGIMRKQ